MNLKEFFIYFDVFLLVLLLVLLLMILTVIVPRTYKFYKTKHFNIIDSDDVSKYGYFTDGGFWKWLTSKQGRIELYEDAKQQQVVYYNNFRIFNFIWKITFVLLCFRVLVIFFGPELEY